MNIVCVYVGRERERERERERTKKREIDRGTYTEICREIDSQRETRRRRRDRFTQKD